MLHPDLIKSFLSGGLYYVGGVSSPTFQGNPDYQGKLILFSGKPETFTDFSIDIWESMRGGIEKA